MNAKQNPENIDDDTESGNPFHDGLVLLAKLISKIYLRDLSLSRQYVHSFVYVSCGAAPAYFGPQTYFEWLVTDADGTSHLVTATSCG